MSKHYEEMLDALRISVIEIVNANPADRDAKLEKSFQACRNTMAEQLARDLPLPIDEADPVSLLGDRLGLLNEAVEAVEKSACPGAHMVSEQALLLAKSVVEYGSLALNAAAADFAVPVEDGEHVEEGMGLYKVASGGGEILVKSALPEEAAAMTADPDDTNARLKEFFLEGLDWLGVPVKLAKKAPPAFLKGKGKGNAQAEAEDEDGEDMEAAEADEGDEEDEGAEGDEEAMEGGEEGMEGEEGDRQPEGSANPFDVIGRAASLALLELNAIKDQLGGDAMGAEDGQLGPLEALGQHLALAVVGADALKQALNEGDMQGEEGMMPEEGEPEGAAPMEEAEPEEALKGTKNAGLEKAHAIINDMKKAAEVATGRAEAAEAEAAKLREQLSKANAAPADPKVNTGVGARALTKDMDGTADSGGETPDELAKRLEKMPPEQQALELMKMSFRRPIAVTQEQAPNR